MDDKCGAFAADREQRFGGAALTDTDHARQLRQALGREIRALRESLPPANGKPVSQRSLASKLYRAHSVISQWESGQKLVDANTLLDLLRLAQVPPPQRHRYLQMLEDADEATRQRKTAPSELMLNAPTPIGALVGREADLEVLHRLLAPDTATDQPRVVCVQGPPGYGKTRLALDCLLWHRERPELGARQVWWIDSSSPIAAERDLVRFARDRRLLSQNHPDADAVPAVLGYLEQRRDWLLVYDNARQPADLDGLIPRLGRGSVLITSRLDEWQTRAELFRVDALSQAAAEQLLADRSGRQSQDFAGLASELWRVPVFLVQAANYLRPRSESECSVGDYMALLRRRMVDTLELGALPEHYPRAGVAVYALAFGEIVHPAARALLLLCSFLHHAEVPLDWLASGPGVDALPSELGAALVDPVLRAEVIEAIGNGLISGGPSSVSLHEVTQDLRLALLSEAERTEWSSHLRQLLESLYTDEFVMSEPRRAADYAGHVRRAAAHARGDDEDARRRADLFRLTLAAYRLGAAVPQMDDLLREAEPIRHALPERCIERPRVLLELGTCLARRGGDPQALLAAQHYLGQGIAECEAMETAQSQWCQAGLENAYAQVLQKLRRSETELDEAEVHYWRALALAEDGESDRRWFHAQQLHNVGALCYDRGQLERARSLVEDALELDRTIEREKRGNEDQPVFNRNTALRTLTLTHVHVRMAEQALRNDRLDEAESLWAAAARLARTTLWETARALEREHPHYAATLKTIGVIRAARGDLVRAGLVLELAERKMAAAHKSSAVLPVADIKATRADFFEKKLNRPGLAEPLARDALAVVRAVYPADSPPVVEADARVERLRAQLAAESIEHINEAE